MGEDTVHMRTRDPQHHVRAAPATWSHLLPLPPHPHLFAHLGQLSEVTGVDIYKVPRRHCRHCAVESL